MKSIMKFLESLHVAFTAYMWRVGMVLGSNPGPASVTSSPEQNVSSNQAIRLLGYARSVSLDNVADTVITLIASGKLSVSNFIVTNASVSLAQATGGLFTAAAAGGTTIVSDAALSTCTGSTIVLQMTVASTALVTGNKLYFRCGTKNTASATCDVYVYGYDFS
jgi:hypothetical protein